MGLVWGVVFVFVLVFGYAVPPWDSIKMLLAEGGVPEDGQTLMWFAFGYTLPLSVGFGALAFAFMQGAHKGHHPAMVAGVAAGVLFAAGEIARALGLGLLPDYANTPFPTGAPIMVLAVKFLAYVLTAYFNAYGSLVIVALALGIGGALQLRDWDVKVDI